jgi:hypothetical protein
VDNNNTSMAAHYHQTRNTDEDEVIAQMHKDDVNTKLHTITDSDCTIVCIQVTVNECKDNNDDMFMDMQATQRGTSLTVCLVMEKFIV